MNIVNVVGLFLIMLLCLFTIKYKQEFRSKVNIKKYKLKPLYGASMFIVDKLLTKYVRRKNRCDKAIRELMVKEDVQQEKYLYIVEKVAICILVIGISFIIGILLGVNEKQQGKSIKSLVRNADYNLIVKIEEEETTKIWLQVPERQLTDQEKEQIIEDAQKDLLQIMLGENNDVDKIEYNLNLINHIGDYEVFVVWDIDNLEVISDEGIIGENVSKEGSKVTIRATLIFEDIIRESSFIINVFPSKSKIDTEKYIQSYVEENNVSENEIILPNMINGHKVHYYTPVDKLSGIVAIVGTILAVALFFIKDKDLEKEVIKRNKQMAKDYPEIVSKILLFYGAGLSIKMTFEEIVKEYEKEKKQQEGLFKHAYEEMVISLNKMKTGISEKKAINDFGKRCSIHCYIKLANIIEQNITRGTKEFTYVLKEELNNVMNERKNSGLKEGNEISTKLLGPMLVMLMISIVIVIIPALMSMNF